MQDVHAYAPGSWEVKYIQQTEFAAAVAGAGSPHIRQSGMSFFDGQFMLVAKFQGHLADIKTDDVADAVRRLAESHGGVLAFAEVSLPGSSDLKFRVEFYQLSAARKALQMLGNGTHHLHNVSLAKSKDIHAYHD